MKQAPTSVQKEQDVKFVSFLVLAALIKTGSLSHAHGEDKPGPHGGAIQMPGPYHTEVVSHKNEYRVYLLDINFKNPIIANSKVEASIKQGQNTIKLNCQAKSDYFSCPLSSGLPKKGELILATVRENIKGIPAVYKLPFTENQH